MRYLHRITSKQGFIDLHNHTSYSFGREYGQIDLTPLQYLEECREYADKFNKKVSFAITDHNNTAGNKEILDAIKNSPEKYKNINFIPGCEYTVACDSLGHIYDREGNKKPIIQSNKLHMLAYGMDIENPVIKYYNTLMSNEKKYLAEFSPKSKDKNNWVEPIKYGNIIFCAKKFLRDNAKEISIEDFAENCPLQKTFNDTLELVQNYVSTKCNLSKKDIEELHKFITNKENLMRYNKADVMEVMSMVEKAGGYTVLAHPYFCGPSKEMQNLNTKDERNKKFANISFDDTNFSKMNKEDKAKNYEKMQNYYSYIYKQLTINAKNPVTKEKISGIVGHELMHSANQKNPYKFETILNIGNEYGLYCTGGSDSHGGLYYYCIPSRIVSAQVQKYTTDYQSNISAYAITKCKFVDNYLEAKKNNTKLVRPNKTAQSQLTILSTIKNKENYLSINDFRDELIASYKLAKAEVKQNNKSKRSQRLLVAQNNNDENALIDKGV